VNCPRAEAAPGAALSRPGLLAVLRSAIEPWLAEHRPTPEQARFLRDLKRCRTAALGGHLHRCPQCGYEVPLYNSCRNRHCPACQSLAEARWVAAREQVLLPVGHHHLVFTLPAQLRGLVKANSKALFGLLFRAVRDTICSLAAETFKASVGFTAVLHTWTRDLQYHPHLHCVVTAGGLSLDGTRWIDRRNFLLPVEPLRARFRDLILAGIDHLVRRGQIQLSPTAWRDLRTCLPRTWNFYTEAPFGRSTHVLAYLGRYTHRVAITDARLLDFDGDRVRFRTRDERVAELPPLHFLDRFLLHILPARFRKIRHYGLYAPGPKPRLLREHARSLIPCPDQDPTPPAPPPTAPWDIILSSLTGMDPFRCPVCSSPTPMLRIPLPPRAVPPIPHPARPP